MSFLKNKHIITALIVTPILAVLAYFAVDIVVKERPQAAIAGKAYPLVARSNCRFTSGKCDLENASFNSQLSIGKAPNLLNLKSSHALQAATIGFVHEDGLETSPTSMRALDETNTLWQLELPQDTDTDTVARLALQANDAFYFAETTMKFSDYKTVFSKDFRKAD